MHGRTTTNALALAVVLTLIGATPAVASDASGAASAPAAPSAEATPADDAAPTPDAGIDADPDVSRGVTHAQNPSVPEGAVWTEHYLPSSVANRNGDPVELHADVLRPAGLPADARTPVILISGPYLSHAGQQADEGKSFTGPSMRHRAFIDDGGLFAAGYTVVFGDLRGFGGSSGCYDFSGPGEQADVRAFVEWAASAPWSTGRVGMYGKSYDAVTGLMGLADRPAGLAAVVAQEPSWNLYDYLYENGIPAENNRTTIDAYNGIAALTGIDHPGSVDGVVIPPDTERYRTNAAYEQTHPECAAGILADTLASDPSSAFWSARNTAQHAEGSTVPLFLTQGWTERNTRPEGMAEFLDAVDGPVIAWAGPWDHYSGNDLDDAGRLKMGRAGWVDEVRAFFDAHLLGAPAPEPAWALQDNEGHWRLQSSWPGVTRELTAPLAPGSYVDTGRGADALPAGDEGDGSLFGTAPRDAQTIGASQTLSAPVDEPTRLSGRASLNLRTQGAGVAHARLWDVEPDGVPTLIVEEAAPLDASGTTRMHLRNVEWTLAPGHALLVTVGTTDSLAWRPSPSEQTVTIESGEVTLPLQSTADDVPTEGQPAPFLATYLEDARWPVPIAATPSFSLAETSPAPVPTPSASGAAPARLAESGMPSSPGLAVGGAAALLAGALLIAVRRSRVSGTDPRRTGAGGRGARV
ncbi:CocE/NonD family hydrolase [Microbacterium sp. NPDC086615]|jgi:putative CocE/NonD family hydrolase|uniref:CocE/NonD family hydrolase n=1 Tax=Microbacterium sp. NPDC086615 TaxID=3154865 RepID=UPI00342E21CB